VRNFIGTSTASGTDEIRQGALVAQVIRHQLDSWLADTMFTSSVSEMTALPSYRVIVGLGTFAVPFLLRELETRPADWFLALAEITKDDPVPADAHGDFDRVRDSWLDWGRSHGFI
jgi:hypothetical protein